MNLVLTKDLEQFIEKRVRRGRYPSPEDVVRAGFASLRQQEAIEALSAEQIEAIFPDIRAQIAHGLEEARAGKLTDGDAFFDELERDDV
jgi:putative addiction module CopG family antidote